MYRKAGRLTAQTGTVARHGDACAGRRGSIAPDPVLRRRGTSSTCSRGERPNATAIRALDVALILHADHELNASTFAARVAAATLTDMYSAVGRGSAALKGPLHGGANAEVMDGWSSQGREPERVDEAILAKFARKRDSWLRPSCVSTEDRGPRTCGGWVAGAWQARPGTTRGIDMSQRIEALVKAEEEAEPERRFLPRPRTTRSASRSISTRGSSR